LNPVRRVAAFFAFLGFLTLASCGNDEEASVDLMKDQTAVFEKMTVILDEVNGGSDPVKAAEELTALGEELKGLKIRLAGLTPSERDDAEWDAAYDGDFADAFASFQKAQQTLFMSGKLTPEINRALTAHLNPAPMPGEGISK